jgi:sugar phosphate isomerase/epimerase
MEHRRRAFWRFRRALNFDESIDEPGGLNLSTDHITFTRHHRRGFLKQCAAVAGTSMLSGNLEQSLAQSGVDWKKQVGLELFTVRDAMTTDFEGVLAKVAEIGYKEIEPASGYNNMEPRAFRGMLDRYGISMPSTHSGARGTGADLEKQLEGFQIMGIRYTEISEGGGGRGAGRGPGGGAAGAADAARGAPGGRQAISGGAPGGNPGQGRGGGRGPTPPRTEEEIKRSAQQINEHGKLAKKFGMKMLIHNHTGEFELLEGGKLTQYDVLLRETDPELVAMQLDIGWASVAGRNILEMFKKSPGRFELWHVKDASGLSSMDAALTPSQRQRIAKLVPVGLGDVDYKTIFASASLAGLKHFCIEQDNANAWGDSVAAARVSYQNLTRMLS